MALNTLVLVFYNIQQLCHLIAGQFGQGRGSEFSRAQVALMAPIWQVSVFKSE